jgi:hypothetical protein
MWRVRAQRINEEHVKASTVKEEQPAEADGQNPMQHIPGHTVPVLSKESLSALAISNLELRRPTTPGQWWSCPEEKWQYYKERVYSLEVNDIGSTRARTILLKYTAIGYIMETAEGIPRPSGPCVGCGLHGKEDREWTWACKVLSDQGREFVGDDESADQECAMHRHQQLKLSQHHFSWMEVLCCFSTVPGASKRGLERFGEIMNDL